jgi:steroid delta-isomerase-like uncharacterized protein
MLSYGKPAREVTVSEVEANKDVVRAYVGAFNRGDLDAVRDLFAPDAQVQGVLGAGQMDKAIAVWEQLVRGLGIKLVIEEMIGEGETVAVRYTERGTFTGEFFGQGPTGKSYELVAMEWFRIRGGKIVSRWGARDSASQARQIGLTRGS